MTLPIEPDIILTMKETEQLINRLIEKIEEVENSPLTFDQGIGNASDTKVAWTFFIWANKYNSHVTVQSLIWKCKESEFNRTQYEYACQSNL